MLLAARGLDRERAGNLSGEAVAAIGGLGGAQPALDHGEALAFVGNERSTLRISVCNRAISASMVSMVMGTPAQPS